MALTADQIAILRAELGSASPPTDDDLDEIYTLRGGPVGVIRHVWSSRLADLLANPASFTISGEYSQSTAGNILAIQKRLGELSPYPDDSDTIPPGGGSVMTRFYKLTRVGQDR